VVLTSLPRCSSPRNRLFVLSNTLMEHYSILNLADESPAELPPTVTVYSPGSVFHS
jgi:hypothetical protein